MTKSKLAVLIGFSVIIGLLILSNYLSVNSVFNSNERLIKNITVNEKKIELLTNMQSAARDRTLCLARMLHSTDKSFLQKETVKFRKLGDGFVRHKEKLLALGLNNTEIALLNNIKTFSSKVRPMHQKISELIMHDHRAKARVLLFKKAIPLQIKSYKAFSEFIAIQRQQGITALERNQKEYQHLVKVLWMVYFITALISFAIVIIISIFISHTQEKLEELVQQRTNDLKFSHDEALREKINAQHANQAKSDFLARMSHELRTPLHAIIGFSDILLRKHNLDEDLNKRISKIKNAGNHLSVLVDDILDFSRIENGSLKLMIEPIYLKPVFEECRLLITPMVNTSKLKLTFHIDAPYVVKADHTRLKQVLLNILTNAVKYNREQGHVSVYCRKIKNNRLRITIEDTGNGIKQDYIDKIFEPFERLGAELTNIQGVGIGLTIAKNLIVMMGGDMGVESTEGIGSIFWIELVQVESSIKPA